MKQVLIFIGLMALALMASAQFGPSPIISGGASSGGGVAAAVAAGTNIVVGTNGAVKTISVADPLAINTANVGTMTVSNALITTIAPTSAQTNYTVALGSLPNVTVIHMANTNAFLTFTGTNTIGYQTTLALKGVTNAIVTRFAINLPSFMTNINLSYFVTNFTTKFVNVYNLDTTGTNVVFSDAGTAPHN